MPADPAWGVAYTLLADWIGKYYLDDTIFLEHFDGLAFHMDSLIAQAAADKDNGLLGCSRYLSET